MNKTRAKRHLTNYDERFIANSRTANILDTFTDQICCYGKPYTT